MLENTSRIFQINASQGGVPKLALRQAEVTPVGLTVDRQIHLHVHGGPQRALCLYPLERILALQAEGHPVFPGAMGENVTLLGVDWEQVGPGTRLRLGDAVEIEVTGYATPCDALRPYFREEKFTRVSQKKHPGWSRVCARVLRTGVIQVGDTVYLLPNE